MFRISVLRHLNQVCRTVIADKWLIQQKSRFIRTTALLSNDSFRRRRSYTENIPEREFLKLQHNPDEFGSPTQSEYHVDGFDEAEEIEERRISERPRGLRTKQYADMIKDHLQNKRIKEAIDVLEINMIQEDRVKPENYIYNLLIGGCARAGYTKKAFQLFNRMRQRALVITGGTYTSLFNACAMSPYPTEALEHANRLREIMQEKGFEPNPQTYNAMIKAYGRCGDILTAFQLVDEMVKKRLPVKVDTMNFLLQACASDKQFGFRHALLVWHKMRRWHQRPDIYSFNLLLRVVRDCGIGDVETTEEVVTSICGEGNIKLLNSGDESIMRPEEIATPEDQLQIEEENHSQDLQPISDLSHIPDSSMPNLIAQKPHLGELIALSEVVNSEDRLMLIGGMRGFINEMENQRVTPDLKTFTELLEVIPPTLTAEKYLMSLLRRNNIRVDMDFLNVLIKKRSMRFDYKSAKDVLKMAKTARLSPDIVTYGVLALGCTSEAEARDLIEEMEKAGVRMNMPILGAMVKQGCLQWNFQYVISIMDLVMREEIKPNAAFLTHLHKFYKKTTGMVRDRDPRIENEREFSKGIFEFKVKMEAFNAQYDLVDRNLEESLKRIRIHPYQQFKENQPEGYEKVKNEKRRFHKKYTRKLAPDENVKELNSP